MTQEKAVETLDFAMDKNLLLDVIKMQAGSVDKAFLELIMNAPDAEATEVHVTLTTKGFSVSDNGRGFRSREEIDSWFRTFGTPHKKGDSVYGRFRMGRGQIMSYAPTVWRSGDFSMIVDIREKGLKFDLVVEKENHKGCKIDGDFYQPLTPSDLIRTQDALRKMCKYMLIPVFINGERISLDLGSEKWTMEDEDAYYLLRASNSSLDAYNIGVHVRGYYGTYGIGGIVVSKQRLEVNFARNDIMLSECAVWKRITTKVRAYAKQFEEKRPTQNESFRDLMMDRLLSGNFDNASEMNKALSEAKVFTDYAGKHFSLISLVDFIGRRNGKLVSVSEHSLRADRVDQKELAVVLSPKTCERAKWMSISDVAERIFQNAKLFNDNGLLSNARYCAERIKAAVIGLDTVSAAINDQHDIVQDKDLTKEERLALRVIRDCAWHIRCAVGYETRERKIRVCSSETVDGYTDGATCIFIERKFLKVSGYQGALFEHFNSVAMLLLHEYIHDADDSTGHGHGAEFYERFHDLACFNSNVLSFSSTATNRYLHLRRKAGYKMRSGDLKALDMVTMESDDDDAQSAESAVVVPIKEDVIEQAAPPMALAARVTRPAKKVVEAPKVQGELF